MQTALDARLRGHDDLVVTMEEPKFFMLDEGTEDFYHFPDDWNEEEEAEIEEDVDLKAVMVVDSSTFHRNILKGHLESGGYKVVAAVASAAEANKFLSESKTGFVAVDIDQTDGGGAKALQILAAAIPKTRFIITSSRVTADQVAQSKMGNQYFLAKPFQKEIVHKEMKKAYEAELKKKPKSADSPSPKASG